MSGIPPRVFTETGTPATEWAATTTTALNADTPSSGMNPTTNQLLEERQARPDRALQEPSMPPTQSFEEKHLRHDPLAQASAASTPGHEFPGAYPRHEETVPHDDLRTKAVVLAESVSSTASSSLSSAYQSVAQYLPESVVNTVSSYVPASYIKDKDVAVASVHDQPHHISLPSNEVSGAGEHDFSQGVGSLPGRVDEHNVTEISGQLDHPSKFQAPYKSDTSPIAAGIASFPSRELGGAKPSEHSASAGTLPGASASAGAALPSAERGGMGKWETAPTGVHTDVPGTLPNAAANEEKNRTQGVKDPKLAESQAMAERARAAGADTHDAMHGSAGSDVQPSQGVHPHADSAAGAAALGAAVGQNHTQRREEKESDIGVRESQGAPPPADSNAGAAAVGAAVGQNQMEKHEEKKEQRKEKQDVKHGGLGEHGQPNKGDGYDTDYHPAALHPADKNTDTEHAEGKHTEGAPAAEKDGEHAHAHTDDTHDHDDAGGAQKTKKAGFMQKMKGEALTLLGKVEKKPHKVEEGQRLKHGEPAQAQEAAPTEH